jgi:hypothetical protein
VSPFTAARRAAAENDPRQQRPEWGPPIDVGSIGFAAMIDIPLSALTRAWLTTVIASAVLFAALAVAQVWNGAVYFRTLPHALQLVADGPPPIIDRWN